ncbi:hypothetical protein QBC43DRAFT_36778 [Cladorrhinum sp. PSN259]|nr:hypothetical protein QBC43DRAFT_36778 [Cladorrhinum sp. PSN259]
MFWSRTLEAAAWMDGWILVDGFGTCCCACPVATLPDGPASPAPASPLPSLKPTLGSCERYPAWYGIGIYGLGIISILRVARSKMGESEYHRELK